VTTYTARVSTVEMLKILSDDPETTRAFSKGKRGKTSLVAYRAGDRIFIEPEERFIKYGIHESRDVVPLRNDWVITRAKKHRVVIIEIQY